MLTALPRLNRERKRCIVKASVSRGGVHQHQQRVFPCQLQLLLGGHKMMAARCKLVASIFVMLSCFAMAAAELGSNITVSGWVIDSACAYTKGLDKPIGPACAKACARNGSPLVILRDDGTIFMPIDANTPSSSQNPRLMPFAGERVTVTGKDYV